jgi:hypothetical protein
MPKAIQSAPQAHKMPELNGIWSLTHCAALLHAALCLFEPKQAKISEINCRKEIHIFSTKKTE